MINKPATLRRLRLVEDNGPQDTSVPSFPGLTGKERLTFKQEQFARLVSEGMGYGEAYRTAYDVAPTTTDNTVYCQGSKLMSDSKIAQRVAILAREREDRKPLDPAQTRAMLTRELAAMIKDPSIKSSDRLKAMELMGKVRGVGLFAEISEVEYSKTTVEERTKRLKAMLSELDPLPAKDPEDLSPKSDSPEPSEPEQLDDVS